MVSKGVVQEEQEEVPQDGRERVRALLTRGGNNSGDIGGVPPVARYTLAM